MKLKSNLLAAALAALVSGSALAAGSAGVERHTQAFLEGLAKGGGQPLETLAPAAAREVLTNAQKGAKLPAAEVSEKTILVDSGPLKLTIVRPVGAQGVLPAFMFFHGGGWILGE